MLRRPTAWESDGFSGWAVDAHCRGPFHDRTVGRVSRGRSVAVVEGQGEGELGSEALPRGHAHVTTVVQGDMANDR